MAVYLIERVTVPTQAKSSVKKKSSLNKKPILVIGVLVLLVLGVGGYAIWKNMSASAAGGWTNLGTVTLIHGTGKVTGTVSACKAVNVAKKGAQVKAKVQITSVTSWKGGRLTLSVPGISSTPFIAATSGATYTSPASSIIASTGTIYFAKEFSGGTTRVTKTFNISALTNC